MKWRCLLFGHKPYKFTDSGYEHCERCGMHSYYDYPHYYNDGKLGKLKYYLVNLFKRKPKTNPNDLPF